MIENGVVYCDCCGKEKLAQVVGDNLVITDRRHGQKHVAVVSLQQILDILANSNHNHIKDQAAKITAH